MAKPVRKRKKRMNQSLPKTTHFPRIYRFITEDLYSAKSVHVYKVSVTSFFSGILLIAIVLQANILLHNRELAQKAVKERQQVVGEAVYWKNVSEVQTGSRDIYYRIATLEYKLGNIAESKRYIQKAIEIDPNFEEIRVLGAKVGATLP